MLIYTAGLLPFSTRHHSLGPAVFFFNLQSTEIKMLDYLIFIAIFYLYISIITPLLKLCLICMAVKIIMNIIKFFSTPADK